MVRFRLNWGKAIEAVVWLASRQPGITFFYASKIIYFADKYHLERYARPITGDIYIAMEMGPVPSRIYDILKQNDFAPVDAIQELADAVTISGPNITSKRAPRPGILSGSDERMLEEAFARFAHLSVDELSDYSHNEPAWNETPLNQEMPLEKVISKDISGRDDLLEEIGMKACYGIP